MKNLFFNSIKGLFTLSLLSFATLQANAYNAYDDAVSYMPEDLSYYLNTNVHTDVRATGASAKYELRTCVTPQVVVTVDNPQIKYNNKLVALHVPDSNANYDATADYFCYMKGFDYGYVTNKIIGDKIERLVYDSYYRTYKLEKHRTYATQIKCVDEIYGDGTENTNPERCATENFNIPLKK